MSSVLIVEDDLDIQELTIFRLQAAGHDVHTVNDGAQALAAAQRVHPDVVVLDWMLPGVSGPEICRTLRATPGLEEVQVLMLTAKSGEADVEEGFTAGVDDYMIKPFSPRELTARVQHLLARTGDHR
ncbi:response regulator transcription factor [Planomonospora venezuelensis]|uniref:DNA-binding response OmpR family regulator n=1 Tax=Planomonospora venezuelensis TaxID=1999 RepID=A0A841DEA8_PLAVE|nr:response regulator [Planomonospora venezuelensis]MBB5967237.1 DNA-binding response OmpR family regulator [Planomonospora venezuelensis]GIN03006.1 hypothetical protein Pve01_46640 [Planomonospora venezuelensis]